jgi:hypothetical protein
VNIVCADCGCLVDRGARVESCMDPTCCCRHLPQTDPDSRGAPASLPDPALAKLQPERPTWATLREALRVVAYRRHLRATTRIAAVVGTVLFAINQLDVVLTGQATTTTCIKAGVTYLVPFTVSNLGILAATRRPKP